MIAGNVYFSILNIVILSEAKNPAKQKKAFPRFLRGRARVRVNWLKFLNRHSVERRNPVALGKKSLSRDWRPYFFCLAKRNRGKKRLPRCRLYPSVLAPHMERLRNSPSKTNRAQTVLAACHLLAHASGAARG